MMLDQKEMTQYEVYRLLRKTGISSVSHTWLYKVIMKMVFLVFYGIDLWLHLIKRHSELILVMRKEGLEKLESDSGD